MKPWRKGFWLAAAFVFTVGPAVAANVEMDVDCPAGAPALSTISTDFHLVNEECSEATVRFFSSIVGNADQSLGGLGINGPVVVDTGTPIVVPAAIDNFPPGCFDVSPGVTDVTLDTPPAIPATLSGTVATFVLITEWDIAGRPGKTTVLRECLVDVQAP